MGINKDFLYKTINEKGIGHKDTISASQELDKEILLEMLKDPVNENIYLKQVIKAKEYEIKNLQKRILELTEQAQMNYESGLTAKDSIEIVMTIASKEGIINASKVNGIR